MAVRARVSNWIAGFLFVLIVCAPPARGQSATTGAIGGVVRDASGAVLPGVTVEASSPALIEKVRVAVSDSQGNYKIVELRPGTYTVTFSLPGFATYKREGIELTSGFTATANGDMRLGAIEETVVVTGDSPLVDVQNVRTQNVMSRQLLDTLPTFKSLGGFTALTLGAVTSPTFQDVGGNKGESVFQMSIHGSRNEDLRWKQDGMDWGASILSGYIRTHRQNTVGIQEVVVEAGGSAESETGGAQMNYVPRDGGNTFSVYSFANYTNSDLQGNNLTADLRARGITATPGVKEIWDYALGVGGPILQDKLWFYQGNRWWGGAEFIPGAYFNKTVGTLFHTPDLTRPAWSSNWARDFGGRLTWQAAPKHKFTYTHNIQRNCNCINATSATTAPEASTNSDNYWNHVVQGTWVYPVTTRLLFDTGVSFGHFPQSSHLVLGTKPDTIGVRELSTGLLYNARAAIAGITDYGEGRRRDNLNGRVSISYVTGSHAFKSGIQMQQGFDDENSFIPNDLTYQFRNGLPASLIQWASPFVYRSRIRSVGFYAQDQWTVRRITVNYGLRFDYFRGYTLAEHIPATQSVRALVCPGPTNPPCDEAQVPTGRFVGERNFDGIDDIPNFKDLSPRVSVAYDLFGDTRTAIKASLHRYVAGLGVGFPNSVHPVLATVSNVTRTWDDRNGNFAPDCNLSNPGAQDLSAAGGDVCGAISNAAFGTPVVNTRRTDEVTTGFANREYNWQASVLLEHQLRSGVAFRAGYYRTWYGNFTVTDNLSVTPGDYDPYCITAPTDSRLPDPGGQLCGFYDLKRATFGRVNNLVKPASDFGDRSEIYNSLDLGVNARFGNGGLLSAGVNIARTTTQCVIVDSPEAGRPGFCDVRPPWSAATQFKINGVYPLPWDIRASAVLQDLPGIPILATYNTPNALIAPSLGRNLAACPTAAGACTATTNLSLVPPQTMFEERLTQMDLRFSKVFRTPRGRVGLMFDIYNVLNASTVLSVNNTYGPTWLRPLTLLAPRLFKFGAEFNF
jgi:hypothetical protein